MCVVCDGRFEKVDEGYERIKPKNQPEEIRVVNEERKVGAGREIKN